MSCLPVKETLKKKIAELERTLSSLRAGMASVPSTE